MNIYVSSSWKQRDRVRSLAILLRTAGHEVYDFTDPACRKTPEIPPERFPELFDPAVHTYHEYIQAVPEWRLAVECNQQALRNCDLCVLLLPCGNDAHADWAFAVGLGKKTAGRLCSRNPGHQRVFIPPSDLRQQAQATGRGFDGGGAAARAHDEPAG